ncbi:MAG: DUF4340 domain-containing protein [Anaeromyxobacteraceae bacterium]
MNARSRLALASLLLVAVTAGAGGVGYWFFARREPAEKEAAARAKRFLAFEPARAVSLRVRAKDEDVRLEKQAGGAWRMTAPVQAAADAREVEALLSRLAGLERRAQSAAAGLSAAALADYGLDAPTARFEVGLADGKTISVAIGGDNRFDGTMFVQPASGEVFVVDGRQRLDLEKNAFELRERRLLRFEPAGVAAVEVTSPAGMVALAQAPSGAEVAWRLTAPVKEPADARHAEDLVAALRDLRATAFEDGTPPATKPLYEATVKLRTGAEQRLRAWKSPADPDGPLLVASSEERSLARVPATALAALADGATPLRDRRVLPGVDREKIASVRVEPHGAPPFTLGRKPAGHGLPDLWTLTSPTTRPLDAWKAQSLAWSLAALEADRIVDAAKSPGPVAITYVLHDASNAELGRVAIGKPKAGEVLLQGAAGRVFAIAADKLTGLATKPEALEPSN